MSRVVIAPLRGGHSWSATNGKPQPTIFQNELRHRQIGKIFVPLQETRRNFPRFILGESPAEDASQGNLRPHIHGTDELHDSLADELDAIVVNLRPVQSTDLEILPAIWWAAQLGNGQRDDELTLNKLHSCRVSGSKGDTSIGMGVFLPTVVFGKVQFFSQFALQLGHRVGLPFQSETLEEIVNC